MDETQRLEALAAVERAGRLVAEVQGELSTLKGLLNQTEPPPPPPPPPPPNMIRLTGVQTQPYDNRSLAPGTLVDATGAEWRGEWPKPVKFGGAADLIWRGGRIVSPYPESRSWSDWHDTYGLEVYDAPWLTIEGADIRNTGDGIKLMNPATDEVTLRGCYLANCHDDAIEGDWLPELLIEDCLIDRAYMAFGMRQRSSDSTSDGRDRTWTIRNSLVWVGPQASVYSGSSPGNGSFFKYDRDGGKSPRVALENVIFRLDQKPGVNTPGCWVEPGKLVHALNVTVVWLGSGSYPVSLPAGVTLTRDVGVWDRAAAQWKENHGL